MRNPILLVLVLFSSVMMAQVPVHWQSRGMGGGGAVYAPSISPFNPDEAWLSCDMSVVSRTFDFGVTWRTVGFDTLIGKRNSTVNFTNHPDTLYGERFIRMIRLFLHQEDLYIARQTSVHSRDHHSFRILNM